MKQLFRSVSALIVSLVGGSLCAVAAGQSTSLVAPGHRAQISGNGEWVVVATDAQLASSDTNATNDIYLIEVASGHAEWISKSASAGPANGASLYCAVSADGDEVAFSSYASNHVVGDMNSVADVFLWERTSGQVSLISVAGTVQGTGHSGLEGISISGDGQRVAFTSDAANLVAGDNPSNQFHTDCFLFDRATGALTCISRTPQGVPAGSAEEPAISTDGTTVAFKCPSSTGLDPAFGSSTTTNWDIYTVDLGTLAIRQVSRQGSMDANAESTQPAISGDGRYVAFASAATNLGTGGATSGFNIYLHDRQVGATSCVSTSTLGQIPNASSFYPTISADGRFVVFYSVATNLVPGDVPNAFELYAYEIPTGALSPLASSADGNQASISDDGRLVAFTRGWSGGTCFLADWWSTCFVDADGDGFGAGPAYRQAGSCGVGFAANNLDCDDTRASTNPSATEICNGLDDDCDGYIDEGLPLPYHPDADGDGYGNPSLVLVTCNPPSGYVLNATDCDDSRAQSYPGALELCDGLDNDCDGQIDEGFISTYCTAGTSVHGCTALIAGVGAPSSSAGSGFNIVVSNVPGQRYGTIFYGFYPANVPWAPNSPSYRCVSFPIQRMGNLPTHGTASQCNGDLTIDFNTWYAANPGALGAPFIAGQVFYAQGWYRDPAAPKQTNLSNGLRFTLCN